MDFGLNFNQLSRSEKLQMYISNMTPVLNKKALFSDGTKMFRNPPEPMPGENVTIKIRTERENVDVVYLIWNGRRMVMDRFKNNKKFDYYERTIQVGETNIEYYFEITSGRRTFYYNKIGVTTEVQPYYNFTIMPGFKTPDWAKGAVMYQIYTDRFCQGSTSNNVVDREYNYIEDYVSEVKDWNKYPAAMGVREFYGGDIQGIMSKLDYLADLGIEVIYLNPMFVSPSNHKYDIQDYDNIDPHFGVIVKDGGEPLAEGDHDNKNASKYITRVTSKENLDASNELFAEFVSKAHEKGIRVILDGVFNHCGSFNKWLDRERIYEGQEDYDLGAYVSYDSPYHTFFKFCQGNWPYNGQYYGWWGHDTLPKLNYEESPKLYEYIMQIARKWVSPPYNVDGWRLDVAADLGYSSEFNHKFWRDFRKNVKEANPDAIIIAEHYGDPSSWLQGDEWDTVMNYDAFMEPLTWFLTGVEKHSDEYRGDLLGNHDAFFGAMRHHMSRFNTQSLLVAMNELSNHDHSRFLTRTNRKVGRTGSLGPDAANEGINKGVLKEAVVIQMTWPGAPTIYYGDEAGVCGWTDPDNRRTYPWGREDKDLINVHKELIRIHKDYQALKTGSIIFLGGGPMYLSYGRFDENDKIVVAVNNHNDTLTMDINVWQMGIEDNERLGRLILTTEEGYDLSAQVYQSQNGVLTLTLPAYSGVIIKNIEEY